MVSFQCEGCGDVLTKKKLDPHRNQCRGAPFTCIDCMTTFSGTEYRAHTSCITEDQKYQGALYREKPSKANKRKSVSIAEPDDTRALVPRAPYVEDAPDEDGAPPHVPTPPPAVPEKPEDSVFDYLVEEATPTQPQMSHFERSEMSMKSGAPSVFSRDTSRDSYRDREEDLPNRDFDERGFSYGAAPINPRPSSGRNDSSLTLEFMTPAAKVAKAKLDKIRPVSASHSRTNSGSEKKRKRGEHGLEVEEDTTMLDAPSTSKSPIDTPGVKHSGLTGGLSRMLSDENEAFPFTKPPHNDRDRGRAEDRRNGRHAQPEDPTSPLKRTRHTKDDSNGLGISIKGRAGKVLSMVSSALVPLEANGKTRRRASSSDHTASQSRGPEGERRERKKHKVHRYNGTSSDNVRHEHSSRRRTSDESEPKKRSVKLIDYRRHDGSVSDSDDDRRRGGDAQMVVFGAEEKVRARCEMFLSYVTKGPESERGYSFNKALKRWHRDADIKHGSDKHDAEKELWKGLRLKKNDRGEVVVFFGDELTTTTY